MRTTVVGFVMALILGATASGAHAQQIRGLLGAGLSVPVGSLGDEAEGAAKSGGIHGLAGVEWMPMGSRFGVRLDGGYQQFCTTLCDDEEGNLDVKYQIIHGSLNGMVEFAADPDGRIRPYVMAGVGIYNYKLRGDDVDEFTGGIDLEETDFGVSGGLGITMDLGGAGIFIEGRFHNVFAEDESLQYLPIILGVRFGG